MRAFINAKSTNEVIFTRGTTEALNLVVSSFADEFMGEGDEVIVSTMEHHSNIVPWQLQAAKKGICLKVIPMNDKGEILMDEYRKLFSERTRIVSVAHVSNVLGTINPVKEMISIATNMMCHLCLTVRRAFLLQGGRSGFGLRLHGVQRTQDVWSYWCGSALRQGGLARPHAAVSGWRRDDRERELREDGV